MERTKRTAESWTYVPLEDREKQPDQQTRITLRPLSFRERMQAWDDSSWITLNASTGERTIASRAYREAGRLALDCITAIENFPADDPKPWPTDREARVAYLEMFPDQVVLEIGNEIITKSVMEETAGKS